MALPPRKHRRRPTDRPEPQPPEDSEPIEAMPEFEAEPEETPRAPSRQQFLPAPVDESKAEEQEILDNWDPGDIASVEPRPMPLPVLMRLQAFVGHYLTHFNATKAAEQCGFSKSYAKKQGPALLLQPAVIDMIRVQSQAILTKIGVTQERVWAEYAYIAFADPLQLQTDNGEFRNLAEIPENLRRAVASVKIKTMSFGEDGESVEKEVKLWNKPQALEKLAQLTGLLKEDDKAVTDLAKGLLAALERGRQRVLEARDGLTEDA